MLTLATRLRIAGASYLSAPGWLQTWAGAGTVSDSVLAVDLDAAGNLLVLGSTNVGGLVRAYVAKISGTGTVMWQRYISHASNAVTATQGALAVDTSGNVSVTLNFSSTPQAQVVLRYSSAGALQWQRSLGNATNVGAAAVAVDASGSMYCCGSVLASPIPAHLAKYSSAGALQWQRSLSAAGSDLYDSRVALDTSGNVFISGTFAAGVTSKMFLAKYSSAGALQWQNTYQLGNLTTGGALAIDGSGNLYFAGQVQVGSAKAALAKLTSAGAVTWCRYLDLSSAAKSVFVGPAGNVFMVASSLLFCYDALGNLAYQRSLGGISDVASTVDHLVLGGSAFQASTGDDGFVSKLPVSGSGQGAYGWLTYADTTQISTTGTLGVATGTLTDSAGSLTDAAGTLTDSAGGMTTAYFNKT